MKSRSERIGSKQYTDASPAYSLYSRQTKVSIGVATALIVGTLVLTWLVRGTVLAERTIWLYRDAPLAPYPGIVVFGITLTGGRYVGLWGAVRESYVVAFLASAVVAVAYAAFGAGILSLYDRTIHGSSILIAAAITTVITIAAAVLVYTTDHSFAKWDIYSAGLMIAGVFAILGSDITGIAMLYTIAFGLVLLGWIVDLVFEIYMVSNDDRSPLANGIGVYIAFMGVFIHILQLVLEAASEE